MKWFLPLLLIAPLAGCASQSGGLDDVQFAKTTVTSLSQGDLRVESSIDFGSLKMMGMDVGGSYNAMPDETQKAAFRQSFITSFSRSFQSTGATADSFGNWRVHSSAPPSTVVATDGKNGTIYVTVFQQGGTQKMTGLSSQP